MVTFMKEWLLRVAAWSSQTLNLFLLFGHHDQTVSARAYVNRNHKYWGRFNRFINFLFFWQDNHTYLSFRSDLDYAQQVTRWQK